LRPSSPTVAYRTACRPSAAIFEFHAVTAPAARTYEDSPSSPLKTSNWTIGKSSSTSINQTRPRVGLEIGQSR
jgi:hypothetical protein